MRLIHDKTGLNVKAGEAITCFRGGEYTVSPTVGCKPHKPSSTGRIYVKTKSGDNRQFFPSVFGCTWVTSDEAIDVQTQLLYNRAAQGLYEQNGPAANSEGFCMYRAGCKKCAIGHLIADNQYTHDDLEGLTILDSPVKMAVERSCGFPVTSKARLMLSEVQSTHDNAVKGGKWDRDAVLEKMNKIATNHGMEEWRPE